MYGLHAIAVEMTEVRESQLSDLAGGDGDIAGRIRARGGWISSVPSPVGRDKG